MALEPSFTSAQCRAKLAATLTRSAFFFVTVMTRQTWFVSHVPPSLKRLFR